MGEFRRAVIRLVLAAAIVAIVPGPGISSVDRGYRTRCLATLQVSAPQCCQAPVIGDA